MDWLRFSNPTDHYPFKRKAKIGPGPMNQTLRKAEEWDCTGGSYEYICRGVGEENRGQRKKVKVDPEYKKEYNRI